MTETKNIANWRESPTEPDILTRRSGESWAEFDLFAPEKLFQFRGHFPDGPVLPGVAQLDWAARLAQVAFGIKEAPVKIGMLKFSQLVGANSRLTLRLDREVEKNRVRFSFTEGETRASSGYFEYA